MSPLVSLPTGFCLYLYDEQIRSFLLDVNTYVTETYVNVSIGTIVLVILFVAVGTIVTLKRNELKELF